MTKIAKWLAVGFVLSSVSLGASSAIAAAQPDYPPAPITTPGGGSGGGSSPVTSGAGASAPVSTSANAAPATQAANGGLAFTGTDVSALVGAAAVAIGAGGLLILGSRRRRARAG